MKLACLCLGLGLFLWARTHAQTVPPNVSFEELAKRITVSLESDPTLAADLCHQALQMNPSWAEGWFDLGAASYSTGQYSEAVTAFTRAGALAPNKGAVWAFRGLTEYELRDTAKALDDFLHAESLGLPDNHPFISTVRTRAALIQIKAGEFTAALEQLKPLALLGDESGPTLQAFGLAALGLTYVPPHIPANKEPMIDLAGRAEWAISAGHDADARVPLQELLRDYANEPGVHYLNGISLLTQDPETARKEFLQELTLSPAHVAALVQVGILDLRVSNTDDAIGKARRAIKLQPNNALAQTVLARAYMQSDQYALALPVLLRATQLAPLNPQLHLYLEQAYKRLGRQTEADKEKEAFLALKKRDENSSLQTGGPAR